MLSNREQLFFAISFCLPFIFVFLAIMVGYILCWFSEVNEMRKEYIDKKNKKLYNRK